MIAATLSNRVVYFSLSGVLQCFPYCRTATPKLKLHTSCNKWVNYINNILKTEYTSESKRPQDYQALFGSVLGPKVTLCTVYTVRFFSPAVPIRCWNCRKDLSAGEPFCTECSKLQPLDPDRNYYQILGISKSFSVDTKALTKIFRSLQAQLHPDKFSLSSEVEQQYAADHSSAINKAYRCLLYPVERALYLLDLAGRPLHEGQLDMDPEFLMEIMEVNEELEEATDKEAVADIGQKNQKILDDLLKEADAAFSNQDIEVARKTVAKIKYYYNIYLKIREYERLHGIMD